MARYVNFRDKDSTVPTKRYPKITVYGIYSHFYKVILFLLSDWPRYDV